MTTMTYVITTINGKEITAKTYAEALKVKGENIGSTMRVTYSPTLGNSMPSITSKKAASRVKIA